MDSFLVREFQTFSPKNSSVANQHKWVPIAWSCKDIHFHLDTSPYVHFQRGARKVRDILLAYKEAIDDKEKKKEHRWEQWDTCNFMYVIGWRFS